VTTPVMTFSIKKRINTEPFIDRTAVLYIVGETVIRALTNKDDKTVPRVDWRN